MAVVEEESQGLAALAQGLSLRIRSVCVHHMRVGEVVPRAVTDRFADRGRNILCSGWVGVDELRGPV